MTIVTEIIDVGGYEIVDNFLTPDQWVRPQREIHPQAGVLHWTGNIRYGADDRANRNFFENRTGTYGSAHTIGDMDSIIGVLPYGKYDAEMAYHVGANKYYVSELGSYPNATTLGHEMCVNRDGNFRESYKRAVWVMAYWCRIHNWNPDRDIYRHYDITRKDCPLPMTDLIFSDSHCRAIGWSTSEIKWMRENLHIDGIQGNALWMKYKSDVDALVANMDKGGNIIKPKAIYNTINVLLDGKFLTEGLLIDNYTYVPLRILGESVGAHIRWDNIEKKAYVNGEEVERFVLHENVSYVHLRDAGKILNVIVDYDGKNALIYSK